MSVQSINVFQNPKYIIIQMIGFLADLFPKQVIYDKNTLLTKPYVSTGSVTIAMGLNCSLGLHMPKKFTYITCTSVLSHIIMFL